MPVKAASAEWQAWWAVVRAGLVGKTVADAQDWWDLNQDGTLTIVGHPSGSPTSDWIVCGPRLPADMCGALPADIDLTAVAVTSIDRCRTPGATALEWAACPTAVWHWGAEGTTLDDSGQWDTVKGGIGGGLSGGCLVAGPLGSTGVGTISPLAPLTSGIDYAITAAIRNDGSDPISFRLRWYQNQNQSGLISDTWYGSVGSGSGIVPINVTAPANPGGGSTVYLAWMVGRPTTGVHNSLAYCDVLITVD